MIHKFEYENGFCKYCYQPIYDCVCPDEKDYEDSKINILRTKKLKRILDDQYELQYKQIKKHDTL